MQDAELDRILADAHLPALVLSMVHMTGDPSLLRPEWQPAYNAFPRGEPIIAEQAQGEIRAKAWEILSARAAGTLPQAPPLSPDTVRRAVQPQVLPHGSHGLGGAGLAQYLFGQVTGQ